MGSNFPGLSELEVEVRQQLGGVKLVCELGVSTGNPLFTDCHAALNSFLAKNYVGSLSKECPAIFVLVLTVLGATLGTGGELWEPILEEDSDGLQLVGLENSNKGKFGEQYRLSLHSLNLPDFSHVEGRTNLTPILMHGGIPMHSSEVVWRKVQEFVRSGTTNGREIVQELRADRMQMRYFNQPAQRFIREAGPFAIDMIGRMASVVLSLAEDPESSSEVLGSRHGLPAGLVEVLQGLNSSASSDAFALPSAHIYLDLQSGQGPYCNLPPIRERSKEVLWTVCGRNYRASRFDEKPVPLEPVSSWTVEALVGGRRLRTRVFPSLTDGGVWLFAETRSGVKLVESSHGIEEGNYFLLAPLEIGAQVSRDTVTATAPEADVGGLGDYWSRHHVLRLDLAGADFLQLFRLTDNSPVGKQLQVLPSPFRPSLEGRECLGIQEIDGLRVFTGPPRIQLSGARNAVEGYTLAIRDPQGVWIQNPLSTFEPTDGIVELGSGIEWVTGQYRIEIVGAMGTGGMSETFVVLLDGRLDMEERLFSPQEVVDATLVYRKRPQEDETSISTQFKSFEYRKYVRSTDDTVLLSLTIPRISFDIGGSDMPPDFETPTPKTLAIEDLEKPRGQRLFIRSGKPAQLLIVARDPKNAQVDRLEVETTGLNASGAIEIDQILESIRLRGVDKTVVELRIEDQPPIPMLTIQQVLDFRIRDCDYQSMDDGVRGLVTVEVSTATDSPNVHVHIRSLERVWEEPVVGSLLERNEETGNRVAICGPIPPGRYAVELAAGINTKPIPSTSRTRNFGSPEQRADYLSTIAGDSSRLAERIVVGENVSRDEIAKCSEEDFLRVLRYFVASHRNFPTDSPEFSSILRCIAREGNSRRICQWMTQMSAEEASTRDLEIFVVRLFPVFLDDPLSITTEGDLVRDEDLDGLVARLWAISPLVGLTFSYQLSAETVSGYIEGLGPLRPEPNYEKLAELRWPDLDGRIVDAGDTSPIFSRGYALVHFKSLWKQCWSGVGPDQRTMDRLIAWIVRGKELMESTFLGRSYQFPPPIASTVPARLRPGRDTENLAIAKFIHNLFRLSWLAARVETPLDIALKASEVLGESYGLSKGLSDRALLLAIMTERKGEFADV